MVRTNNTCRVWSRVERKRNDGTIVKLRFQDLPRERFEEAVDFNIKFILRDETIHRATGVYKNAKATQEYRTIIYKMFELNPPHVTICCVDDGPAGGAIAGISKMTLVEQSSSFSEFLKMFDINTKEMEKLIKAAFVLEEPDDLKERYQSHFYGKGMVIHPNYRGLGIATEFVRLRRTICEELDVPMCSALYTARGSQRAAERNGWKLYDVILPQEVSARTGIEFEEDTAPFKLMYITRDI